MTIMSDIPRDLVEEKLFRVPVTYLRAVRSTCKEWNNLYKDQRFRKKHCGKAAKESLAIMNYDFRVFLTNVNLHGLHNHEDLVDPSIKEIGKLLNQVGISEVYHCDGLLLCVTVGKSWLVVWNPYLGQVRWILPRNKFNRLDKYGIGYDNNNNYKIWRLLDHYDYTARHRIVENEIYDFKSNSWRVLDVTLDVWYIKYCQKGSVSLKGNTYFVNQKIVADDAEIYDYLVCFDFTREILGKTRLLFNYEVDDIVTISSVREEQLAVLLTREDKYEMEVWITTKIEPNAVTWRKFIFVEDERILSRISFVVYGTFFIDEEKKFVVVCVRDMGKRTNNIAYIREDGYYKEVDLGESKDWPLMCSYVPSLVQIQ